MTNTKNERLRAEFVWYHTPTDKLGYALIDVPFWGTLFFFDKHDDNETLDSRFMWFVDDPRSVDQSKSKDFINLGLL